MAKNRVTPQGGRPEPNDKNLASSLHEFSKSLDSTATAILALVNSFKDTAKTTTSEVKGTAKGLNKSTIQFHKNLQEAVTDAEVLFERSRHNTERAMTGLQKLSTGLLSSLKILGKQFVREYTSAVQRVSSKYKSEFSNITVRMQWTRKDYQNMVDATSKMIRSEGWKKQVSVVDYLDSLTSVLDTGLRGEVAQRQAFQNLITNKLVPQISTNTTTYRKMTKQFGEAFDKNLVAISKFTEYSARSAEGLEEQKLQSILSSLQRTLIYSSATGEYSPQQALDTFDRVTYAVNALEKAGVDSSTLISEMQSILEGNVESVSDIWHSIGIGSASDLQKKLFGNTFDLIGDIVSAYGRSDVNDMSLTALNQLNSALGANLATGMEIRGAILSGKLDLDKIKKDYSEFDSKQEYESMERSFEDGLGQTRDAIADKVEENTKFVVDTAKFVESVPRIEKQVTIVTELLSTIASVLLLDTVKGSKSGGWLGKLFGRGKGATGGAGAGGEAGGGFMPSFRQMVGHGSYNYNPVDAYRMQRKAFHDSRIGAFKTAFGDNLAHPVMGMKAAWTGAGNLAGKLTNVAAGPLSLLASTAMMGVDAFQAGKAANEEGMSGGEIFGESLRGLAAGTTVKSREERDSAFEAALRGEKQKTNWSQVGANATKIGLLGAGVGTAVGGWAAGIGTAIGGAVGTAIGAITNYFDQRKRNKLYNNLAESVEKSTEAFDSLRVSQDDYKNAIDLSKDSQSKINLLAENIRSKTLGSEESLKAFKDLQELYPEYLGNITDINKLTQNSLELLKWKVEFDKSQKEDQLKQSLSEALGKSGNVLEDIKKLNRTDTEFGLPADIVSGIATEVLNSDLNSSSTKKDVNEFIDKLAKEYRIEASQVTNVMETGGVLSGGKFVKSGKGKYHDFVDKAKAYQEDVTNMMSLIPEAGGIATQLLSAASSLGIGQDENDELWKAINSYINDYNDSLDSKGLGYFKIKPSNYLNTANISGTSEANTKTVTVSHKLGAYNIYNDGEVAELHQGEMVLTSSNANMLRQLGVHGVSGLLTGLTALSNAQVIPFTQNTANTAATVVVSAIQSQTTSIVSVLTSIYNLLYQISAKDSRSITPTPVSASILNFEVI